MNGQFTLAGCGQGHWLFKYGIKLRKGVFDFLADK
jgi:hypothetical protein